MKEWIIIGAGGLGAEVLWAGRSMISAGAELQLAGVCDDAEDRQSGERFGAELLGTIEKAAAVLGHGTLFTCSVGNNRARAKLVQRALAAGWVPQAIVDTSVRIGPNTVIGPGSYVGALSVISPHAKLGAHALINQGVTIGHDSILGDFVQVCPGGRVSGNCVLGEGAFLGSNGVIAPGVSMGAWSTVGASSFLMKPLSEGMTAMGNPARPIFHAPMIP